ncbi:MAG: hypothetical protein N3H30_02605 [Candidatus Micrarchaeota archaeon]|nr:hypothetical protein [Candidatus Micrarchaeota archaeon]
MKIVEYDGEFFAILVKKGQLQNAGFQEGEDVYVVTLEKGMLAVIRKTSFKEHLKQKIRSSILEPGAPSNEPVMGADVPQQQLAGLSQEELALLRRLVSVRFEQRAPSYILPELSENEKAILHSLIDKGVVSIYKGGKYSKEGVYTIPKGAYGLALRERAPDKASEPQPEGGKATAGLLSQLEKQGFIIIENDELAKSISYSLREKIRGGQVRGIRGFDSKYYIFTAQKFSQAHGVISKFLQENKRSTLTEISKGTSLDEALCKGVLTFMLEESEVIEKSRGRYELV